MNWLTKNWATLLFLLGTAFLIFRKFVGVVLTDDAFQSIIFTYFGIFLSLIWYNNKINEKKINSFIEDEEKRDSFELKRQDRTFKILNRLTSSIVEIFPNSEYHKKYYEFRISTASEKIDDLTWASFDKEGKLDAPQPKYLEKIQTVADGGINYDEIFVFENDISNPHYERLQKLKYHYEKAKKSSRKQSRYSCAYFDISKLGRDFPRVQFTLIDNDEILFTSSANGNEKFKVQNKQLTKVFKNYYDQAWRLSDKLIQNGIVVNEKLILELIKPLLDERK
jgi:hypothetical protein